MDTRVVAGDVARLHLFQYQQPRPRHAGQFVQQQARLLGTGCAAHQHRRAAELDDTLQARRRQARVQRQVTGTCLEAADDHAQQWQAPLGQQRDRLIDASTRSDQRMAQAVGCQVQAGIVIARLHAAGHRALWVRGDLCLELRDVALLQGIGPFGAVARLKQEAFLCLTQQRQLADLPVETLHQRQQQALELGQQALDG
ncbi:hypothetical protein D3C78_882060 [compost metagenome]